MWFLISKHLFCDFTKYVEFLIDEMMTPVFYLSYLFYIIADTKFRACALIIFGCYHYSKELKGKNDSWYHTIDLFISQNHNNFWYHKINFWQHNINFWYHKFDIVVSKHLLFDIIKRNMWCHKFDFLILQNQFLVSQNYFCDITKSEIICSCHKIGFVISKTWICDITQ